MNGAADVRGGPPWEQEGPAVARFVDTAKGVLLDPTSLFRGMRREGGLGAPLAYALIGILFGAIAAFALQFMFRGFVPGMGFGYGRINPARFLAAPFALIAVVPLIVVVATIGVFIQSGLTHLMLVLLGSARFPFETTFRVSAYSHGSSGLLNVVPICGGILGAVWGVVVNIIGLAQAQETSTGKAAAAVLAPAVLCCVIIVALAATLGALVFGALAAAGMRP
jgi:hypothetical protein